MIVFNSPQNLKKILVKRCIGLPGDTINIIKSELFVNNESVQGINDTFDYRLYSTDTSLTNRSLEKMNVLRGLLSFNSKKKSYLLTATRAQAAVLKAERSTKLIYKVVKERGNNKDLFPQDKRNVWSRDYYGPLIVPSNKSVINLNAANYYTYSPYIQFEGNTIRLMNDKVYINNKISTSYKFTKNYYFLMGDNRHHSIDSRWIGFVPEDLIIGKAIMIGWSEGQLGSLWNDRLLSLIR